jgi:hypothetical protein
MLWNGLTIIMIPLILTVILERFGVVSAKVLVGVVAESSMALLRPKPVYREERFVIVLRKLLVEVVPQTLALSQFVLLVVIPIH